MTQRDLNSHQSDLRRAYVRGGPGAIVSGLIWLAAAFTATYSNVGNGFCLLFFGGMFIFPISKLIVKFVFGRESESRDNPGGLIVIETVFPMIGCLFAAYLLIPHRPEAVFPVAAIAVGAHYFGFRTAYGDWTYWFLGSILCLVGVGAILVNMPPSSWVPFVVAGVEVIFGIWFVVTARKIETDST